MKGLGPDHYLSELSNMSGVSINILIADGWRERIQRAITVGATGELFEQIQNCVHVISTINARQTLNLLLLGFNLHPGEDDVIARKTMPAGEMQLLRDLLIDKAGVSPSTEVTITVHGNERVQAESACGRYSSYEFAMCDLGLRTIAAATRNALWELADHHCQALASILGDESAQLLERTGHTRHAKTQCLTVSPSEANKHIEMFRSVLGDLSMRENINLLSCGFEMDAAPHSPEMLAYRILQAKCVPDLFRDHMSDPRVSEDEMAYVAINSHGIVIFALRESGFQHRYGHYRTPEGRRALLAGINPAHTSTIPALKEISELTGMALEQLIDDGFARYHPVWHSQKILPEFIAGRIKDLQSLLSSMNDDHGIDLLASGFTLKADASEIAVVRKDLTAKDLPIAATDFDNLRPSDPLTVEFIRNGWLQVYSADDCITHAKWNEGRGERTLNEALGA